jgi:hypothetical protein
MPQDKTGLEETIISLETKIQNIDDNGKGITRLVYGAYGGIIGYIASVIAGVALSNMSSDSTYFVYGVPLGSFAGATIGAACSRTLKGKRSIRLNNKLKESKVEYESNYGSTEEIMRPAYLL